MNFLETDIHFWPITNEFIIDNTNDKKIFDGQIVIVQNDTKMKALSKRSYSYYYPKGLMEKL